MKCIKLKKDNVVRRVANDLAHHLVTVTKEAIYVAKKEWKQLRGQS